MMKRLFKGGTVVSGEGLKKIDLLVKGEKILAAGKNLEFQDAETIDVRGKLLFPGFIDAHTHMAAKFNDITRRQTSLKPEQRQRWQAERRAS